MNKKYWTGLDELHNTAAAQEALTTEFKREQSVEEFLSDSKLKETNTGRRDFLKFMGFSVAAATLAACETPVVKSIPYVVKPEEITPGVANYYASTYYDGNDYANVLVKTREGRPIFIKGNKQFGVANGAVNSRINASVISLYDSDRLQGPKKGNADISWTDLDAAVKAGIAAAGKVRILSNTIISPSTSRAIAEFSAKYPGKVGHVQYDTVSYSGITSANKAQFGKAVVPSYDFSKAKTIVSIGADFLGTWITPNIFSAQYGQTRRPEGAWMSKHIQFETNMSLTGSNADERVAIKPSEEGRIAAAILGAITGNGSSKVEGINIEGIAKELKSHAGHSLVVAGSNDSNVQLIVNAINKALGNYGHTIDIEKPTQLFRGNDTEVAALVEEMNRGEVGALIVYGCNPSYSWYDADKFNAGLAKVAVSVSFALYADETASRCTYIAPDHHYLESWNDLSAFEGRIDLVQPTITPLYNSRYAQESLLRWADNGSSYYDYIRQTHNVAYTPAAIKSDDNWHQAVHNGTFAANGAVVFVAVEGAPHQEPQAVVVESAGTPPTEEMSNLDRVVATNSAMPAAPAEASISTGASFDVSAAVAAVDAAKGGEWEVAFYQKVTMGNGSHANNPYLQETPDPITKTTWDNYITMSPADMKELGLNTYLAERDAASVAKVSVNGKELELPVVPAPGQKRKTIGIALGYGRGAGNEKIGKAAYQTGHDGYHIMDGDKRTPIGKNAFGLVTYTAAGPVYSAVVASVAGTGAEYSIASTQLHSTVMGRESVVKETTLAVFLAEKDKKKGQASFNKAETLPIHEDVNGDGKIDVNDRVPMEEYDLWREHPVENVGHRWGLTIDLTSCIGCGACITACHTENNVSVVGKDEVLRHRDMHWMRIDRYFSSEFETLEETVEKTGKGTIGAYRHMEDPSENPKTVHMPMMCQHCNHAPCETVCPVAATTHSNEGLNNMAYNRCIGTRYCANNCPYKVRRFNWFNYVTNDKFAVVNPAQDEMTRMVLNPDVTVRGRGVMEKCSMCQQRIQAGKLEAKKAGVPLPDGSIETACMEACPTHAIIFGDLNDTKSFTRERAENNRSYHALEEVGIKPNIYYMTKVRNVEEITEA